MSKGSTSVDARERARQLAAQQAKKTSKSSTRWIQFTVLGVIALIVAIVAVVIINGNRNKIPDAGPVPSSANQYGGIVLTADSIEQNTSTEAERDSNSLGESTATYKAADGTDTKMPLGVALPEEADNNGEPVRLTIFQDYNCVHCAQFEAENADAIAELVASGDITLEIRNLTFLDANSPTLYSARANNVAYSVANQVSTEDFLNFQKEIFTHQGQGGLSNEELVAIAEKYGADVKDDVANNTWRPFIQTVTLESSTNGISGTPTVFADGEVFSSSDFNAWITEKIEAKKQA
ncbi:disulfide bond formation protein DsbA [Rothia nasimurium]|uniref:Disulfide bond formation protein DsbA n=1 Tax=Rothia nasimurium TaxID=85336 RepID=A0A1Y1RSJ5_9MICC|nr:MULTISPECIES: thioredoxin domain-containing protein [Rothia]ORC25082.1 disulfide bond formation protein DsbA [Rothia nasimurium]